MTVIDRRNHHVFQPLLYQVATASLSPADISSPIRTILRGQTNCQVVLAEITAVDVADRRLIVQGGYVRYDYLILAAGATHAYFGHDEWATIAPGLKSIEDATELRRRILLAFESAEYEGSEAARRAALTFGIVGGGTDRRRTRRRNQGNRRADPPQGLQAHRHADDTRHPLRRRRPRAAPRSRRS